MLYTSVQKDKYKGKPLGHTRNGNSSAAWLWYRDMTRLNIIWNLVQQCILGDWHFVCIYDVGNYIRSLLSLLLLYVIINWHYGTKTAEKNNVAYSIRFLCVSLIRETRVMSEKVKRTSDRTLQMVIRFWAFWKNLFTL